MRKYSQHNNDERTHFFRKYTSHTSFEMVAKGLRKGYVWEVSWRLNILTPSFFVFSSTSFLFCWAAQSGVLRAHSPLLGAGSLYSILSPTRLTLTHLNCLSHRVISLFNTNLLLVGVTFAPNSTRPQSRLYPDIFAWMPLFYDWQLGRRSTCYSVSARMDHEDRCYINMINLLQNEKWRKYWRKCWKTFIGYQYLNTKIKISVCICSVFVCLFFRLKNTFIQNKKKS